MNNVNNYRQTHISSASPMELVLMLYDEAIRSLSKAEESFTVTTPERFETIHQNIMHAQNVITELAVSLDMGRGGEIAANLQRLYDFMHHHLCHANARKIVEPIREVRLMLEELRDAWKTVAKSEVQTNGRSAATGPGGLLAAG